MTQEERLKKLIKTLKGINYAQECDDGDPEEDHMDADRALLQYINNEEVTELFHNLKKWYA